MIGDNIQNKMMFHMLVICLSTSYTMADGTTPGSGSLGGDAPVPNYAKCLILHNKADMEIKATLTRDDDSTDAAATIAASDNNEFGEVIIDHGSFQTINPVKSVAVKIHDGNDIVELEHSVDVVGIHGCVNRYVYYNSASNQLTVTDSQN